MFEFLFYIITRLLNILIYAVGVYSNDDCTLYTIQCTLYGVNTATYISIYMYIHTRKPKHMDNITWRCVFGDTHIPIVSWNTITDRSVVSGQRSVVSGRQNSYLFSPSVDTPYTMPQGECYQFAKLRRSLLLLFLGVVDRKRGCKSR